MNGRLPAHLEVSGLIRAVEAAGGFAAVLAKGERDAGTILVVLSENGTNSRLFERMPDPETGREWRLVIRQDPEKQDDFSDYLGRRRRSDPDLWIVELDIVDGERFIGLTDGTG